MASANQWAQDDSYDDDFENDFEKISPRPEIKTNSRRQVQNRGTQGSSEINRIKEMEKQKTYGDINSRNNEHVKKSSNTLGSKPDFMVKRKKQQQPRTEAVTTREGSMPALTHKTSPAYASKPKMGKNKTTLNSSKISDDANNNYQLS